MILVAVLSDLLGQRRTLAVPRNPHFAERERAFLKEHPICLSCGGPATTAHHTKPVHAFPALEMDESLWAPVCHDCHFVDGHARNWSNWVENFFELMAEKRKNIRPKDRPRDD